MCVKSRELGSDGWEHAYFLHQPSLFWVKEFPLPRNRPCVPWFSNCGIFLQEPLQRDELRKDSLQIGELASKPISSPVKSSSRVITMTQSHGFNGMLHAAALCKPGPISQLEKKAQEGPEIPKPGTAGSILSSKGKTYWKLSSNSEEKECSVFELYRSPLPPHFSHSFCP